MNPFVVIPEGNLRLPCIAIRNSAIAIDANLQHLPDLLFE